MRVNLETQITGEQIAYILCRYFKKYREWPIPKNGIYSAIKVYLCENGTPRIDRVAFCQNGAPILYDKALSVVERYFPDSLS